MTATRIRGISLANKCLFLFGGVLAVIFILTLAVPWMRTSGIVHDYQQEVSSQLADAWLHDGLDGISGEGSWLSLNDLLGDADSPVSENDALLVGFIPWKSILEAPASNMDSESGTTEEQRDYAELIRTAFTGADARKDVLASRSLAGQYISFYARSIKASDLGPVTNNRNLIRFLLGTTDVTNNDPIVGAVVVIRDTNFGQSQLSRSRLLILIAGLVAIVVAIMVMRAMLAKLIFKPMRRLQAVIETVTEGHLEARSNLKTGDELELLSGGLDQMLDQLTETQDRLQRMNESLDLKVAELAEANVGLWESTRFKTEFLANISHELRTPLNSIIGFTELLHDKAMQEDEEGSRRVRYLSNILNSGHSLLEMINELLDMAKIEAGRMEVNVEPSSLTDIIEGLVRIMSPQADARSLRVVTDLPEDLPLIETDPGKVQQVLYNLLSNAVKFSPDNGTIHISAECRSDQDSPDANRIVLSVSDEGPGIPADMHDIIFEKFRQVDASHTRSHMGTGLGLAICRDLVDMLHGELWLQSADGEGTTFFVSLGVVYRNRAQQSLMGGSES